jgi:transcriptional regulator with XRE-family HTH domain
MKKQDLVKSVCAAVKELRISKDVSQVALAEKSGVDRSYIIRLETGTANNPSIKQIEKLVKALGGKIVITIS